MKDYNENKESPYLKYWNVNNLYEWAISQKLPLSSFKWIKNISEINKDFVKRFNEKNEEGYFFKLMLNILKHCMNFTMVYLFLLKEWKSGRLKNLYQMCIIKRIC